MHDMTVLAKPTERTPLYCYDLIMLRSVCNNIIVTDVRIYQLVREPQQGASM